MSAPTSSMTSPSPTPSNGGGSGGGGNAGPTSSPLLFFVALGFGVVFTNLWIIVGVKYCFRYNQRNRRQQHDENGEPIDMATMPRTHRRRREKKLMTMEEVNDRFPLLKYKAWMSTRAEEGLPTAGGVAALPSPTPSVRNMEVSTSMDTNRKTSQDLQQPTSPSSSAPQNKETVEKGPTEAPKGSAEQPGAPGISTTPKNDQAQQHTETPTGQAVPADSHPPPALTRQEVQDDNDLDDDDQIQIAVPTEMLANPGDSCAICIDTLEDDDDVRGLTCGHAFHASCLDPWLTSRRACCPLCKADYYVPKPRPEGEAAAEADRQTGRRPQGMAGIRTDTTRPTHYAFMNRRDGRPRMILPGRFMAMGHFDEDQSRRYGFPTAPRPPRPSGRSDEPTTDAPEIQREQPNTWRSRLPTITVPRPSFPGRFRRGNATAEQQPVPAPVPDTTATANLTPGQLEAGNRS
ncbi:MAG: hypothetical protein Q9220_006790 [cf. Caloplaca sp. 1 TL-2023]